ncbi:hypothetical protein HanRHA438_Chr10g0464381 [Helianthus annuus]|nr:hypothetical protein HanHA89_Chr10g0393261 [Helianthus annuus]KAJ0697597.1 hypothetical protein HanLR1_Chr10g0370701 [Helianthus annuus]KAJ0880547.1 hypothetical protein HanRHA438_Chr10g0464381 [Helianthus annuus]
MGDDNMGEDNVNVDKEANLGKDNINVGEDNVNIGEDNVKATVDEEATMCEDNVKATVDKVNSVPDIDIFDPRNWGGLSNDMIKELVTKGPKRDMDVVRAP